METLEALIDSQLIDVYCCRCRQNIARTLGMLRNARDMHCPMCDATIVLNTSKIKAEIKTLERQMQALHRQLMDTITVRTLPSPDTSLDDALHQPWRERD